MATAATIIKRFELFMDDTSELSSDESLDLLNKIYQEVCFSKQWMFLRKEGSLTQSTSLPYIALPTDFSYMVVNDNFSNNVSEFAANPVVYLGSDYTPIYIVGFADRRNYEGRSDTAYIDLTTDRLVFSKQPTSAGAITFDYHAVPTDLITSTSPVLPSQFHDIIYHGMCADDFIIQQSDKAKSYQHDNKRRYMDFFDAMTMWNSKFTTL